MPFAALHLIGEDGQVSFAGSCGSDETHPDHWRGAAETAVAGERVLEEAAGGHAVLLPVDRPGSAVPAAALILGTSPKQRLDDGYRDFFRMVARQLSGALSSAVGLLAAEQRAEELAALDRAKTEFFSNVSHEFRTPLTLMLGPLGDALADPDPDPAVQRERVEVAHRGALRLLRLVNALLDLSRFESGRVTASFAPVDLGRLAHETAAVFRSATDRSGLELVVDAPADGATIDADADMVEKILLNLLSNAYKFTLEGRIELRVRIGERAVIEVTDSGVGIPEAELPLLFERFQRVGGARGRGHEGSGIGLALVNELARAHGGEASVSSAVGAGSTFRVELPLHQDTAGEPRARRRGARGRAASRLRARGAALGRRQAHDRRPAGRRGRARRCSSSTTTPTCASTSPGCWSPNTRCAPPSTAPRPSSSSPSACPTSC